MSLLVLRGGLRTSVQDFGAYGFARYGVPERGAIDMVWAAIANMLVGNDMGAAVLEASFDGPHVRFERAATIAICGADMEPTVDGEPVGMNRPIDVGADTVLRLAAARRGARAYLAVGGGIEVPVVLGCRSTHLGAGFGGFEGRILRTNDRVALGAASAETAIDPRRHRASDWSVAEEAGTPIDDVATIRFMPSARLGAHAAQLARGALTVAAASDRVGLRIAESIGAHRIAMPSEPAVAGAVQLPPDGRPIVLLNDHQTTGGYPIIAHMASVDLPALGQARPFGSLRFVPIDLVTAQRLLVEREQHLRRLKRWIDLQRGQGAPTRP